MLAEQQPPRNQYVIIDILPWAVPLPASNSHLLPRTNTTNLKTNVRTAQGPEKEEQEIKEFSLVSAALCLSVFTVCRCTVLCLGAILHFLFLLNLIRLYAHFIIYVLCHVEIKAKCYKTIKRGVK